MVNFECINTVIAFMALVLFVVVEWPRLQNIIALDIKPFDKLPKRWLMLLLASVFFLVGLSFGFSSELISGLKMIIRHEPYQFSQVIVGIDTRQTSRFFMVFAGFFFALFGLSVMLDSDWRHTASLTEWVYMMLVTGVFGILLLYLNLVGLITSL